MLEIIGDIRLAQYSELIKFLLRKCDAFTLCLPNYGKRAYFQQNQDKSKSIKYYVAQIDDGSQFERYKNRVSSKIDIVANHLISVRYDVIYGSNLYDREREIYIFNIDSTINSAFFDNVNVFDWRYPDFPEDLCFYKQGQCFMEVVAHERNCFFYLVDEELIDFLDNLDVDYCEYQCDDIPMLKY